MWAKAAMTCEPGRRSKGGQRCETGCSGGPGLEPAARAQAPAGGEAQDAIRGVGDELPRLERRIAELCATPPGSVPGKGETGLEPAWAQDPSVGETQDAIWEAVVELRWVEKRIGELCESLPAPGYEFQPVAELWGVLDCVKRDPLADAIWMLEVAANQDEDQLRREYDWRHRLLADADSQRVPRRPWHRSLTSPTGGSGRYPRRPGGLDLGRGPGIASELIAVASRNMLADRLDSPGA